MYMPVLLMLMMKLDHLDNTPWETFAHSQ